MHSRNIVKSAAVVYETDNVLKLKTGVNVDNKPHDEEIDNEINLDDQEELRDEVIKSAKGEADAVLSEAAGRARMIIEEAEREAKIIKIAIEESARKEGFEKGYNEGVLQAEQIKQSASEELESAQHEKAEMLSRVEPEVVELIVSIVDKLLPKVAAFNRGTVVNLIKQGLEGATIKGTVNVHVSKEDYDATLAQRDEITASLDTSVILDIVADPALKANDCIIETGFGNIDCSLDAQYNTLRENLYYILENR